MRLLLIILIVLSGVTVAKDVIVYTCYQNFDSRVYILEMDGTVLDYFQYDFYRLCDMELVDGEVHVVDAFAPRSFILDLETGSLDLIIDDWSLYYFYDIAFDGSYLYVTEWDMNRYLPDGTKDSSTGFDGDVLGSTYVNGSLYTLTGDSLIKVWDISLWPDMTLTDVIAPPSPDCRGLTHDGEYFWTAESRDGQLGSIYCFDSAGNIIAEVAEPSWSGWSACIASGYPSELQMNTWAGIKSIF